jgi:TetR/AcrR family transcriptional regulator, regulator of biofilm formation and stress response
MPAGHGEAQERSRRRREVIVQATIELIAEGGPKAVTHRAVSARAGLPPASAGYYFKTVDDLIEAALRQYTRQRMRELTQLFDEAVAGVVDPLEVGERIATALVRGTNRDSVCQYEVYLEAARNPALRDAVDSTMAGFEQVAAERLRALGVRSPRLAAKAFVAVADGFALHRLAAPLPVQEDLELMRLTLTGTYVAFANDGEQLARIAAPSDPRAGSR